MLTDFTILGPCLDAVENVALVDELTSEPQPNSVSSRLARFTEHLVTVAEHAVSDDASPAVKKDDASSEKTNRDVATDG